MYTSYAGRLTLIRPFTSLAEFEAVDLEDYSIPDPFRGPRWWPASERRREFEEHGMLKYGEYSLFAVVAQESGEVAGLVASGDGKGALVMDMGTYICSAHRHRGYGREAKQLMLCFLFENHPIQAVHANTMEHHLRARAGLEACGLRCYGRLRGIEQEQGKFYDEVQYVIFREEWEATDYRHKVKRGM